MMTDPEHFLTGTYFKEMPVNAARALEGMEPADVADCIAVYEPDIVAAALGAMRAGSSLSVLKKLPPDKASAILGAMDRTSAAAILRLADDQTQASLTQGLQSRRARSLRRVARYPVEVVGAWCDPFAPVWLAKTPAGKVAAAVKAIVDGPPDPLVIVDDANQFVGCLLIADLLSAKPLAHIGGLAPVTITPLLDTMTLESAGTHDGWLDYPLMPVIDMRGRFVGTLSRRRLNHSLGQGDLAPLESRDDTVDFVSGTTANATVWLGTVLEALLAGSDQGQMSRNADGPGGAGAKTSKKSPNNANRVSPRRSSRRDAPDPEVSQ